MTVKELFNHFSNWFSKISYQVSPAVTCARVTGDFGVIVEDDNFEGQENQSFLNKFGDYIIEYWEFLNVDNSIFLLIKKK